MSHLSSSNSPFILHHGRGAADNPVNRFEKIAYVIDPDCEYPIDPSAPATEFFKDTSKSVISTNDSPDVGFEASLNPYRGCEHGCIYCYARPTHEYFGLSSGLDFESRIFVKEGAPELLKNELMHKRWKPKVLVLSGVTDCYQPIERKLEITRRCLQVLAEFRNPAAVITKNQLVARDIDIFQEMMAYSGVFVNVSVTSLDPELARVLEPRASTPVNRLAAIRRLSSAGIPVNAMVAPIIPGLNDHEIPAIVKAVAEAGAVSAAYVIVRLPYAVKDLFTTWLDEHFPDKKFKVLNRIRALRGGRLNDPRFSHRMRGEGVFADQIRDLFRLSCNRAGLNQKHSTLSVEHFHNPYKQQLELFDGFPPKT